MLGGISISNCWNNWKKIVTSNLYPHGKANCSDLVVCDEHVIWQDGGNDGYWSVQLLTVGHFLCWWLNCRVELYLLLKTVCCVKTQIVSAALSPWNQSSSAARVQVRARRQPSRYGRTKTTYTALFTNWPQTDWLVFGHFYDCITCKL